MYGLVRFKISGAAFPLVPKDLFTATTVTSHSNTVLLTSNRRLHNEELNDLYCSPNIVRVIKSKRMRWAGHVTRVGELKGVYRVLVGKPEGRRPLGRPRRR